MMRVYASLLAVVLLATACSTPGTRRVVRFHEQDQANLIVRYYSDETSYVLKPQRSDGPFLSVLKREDVLKVAKQLRSRDLAVVILVHYACESDMDVVKQKWTGLLTDLGYRQVVFLGGYGGKRVDGLPILAKVDRDVGPIGF